MGEELKPLSDNVRYNWELWCEAAFAKNARSEMEDNRVTSLFTSASIGLAFGLLCWVFMDLFLVFPGVFGIGVATGSGFFVYYTRQFSRLGAITERLECLRLADVRAEALHDLYQYMVELQKKLLERSRLDVAYKIGEKVLTLSEHLEQFSAQMEVLETSFRDHGELGALPEIGEIKTVGTRAIAGALEDQRDAGARQLAVREVEATLRR